MSDELLKALTQHGPLAIICGAQLWILVILARALAAALTEIARAMLDVAKAMTALQQTIEDLPQTLKSWLLAEIVSRGTK